MEGRNGRMMTSGKNKGGGIYGTENG